MAQLILYALVTTLICTCVAQDFEPNPLEDPTTPKIAIETTTDAPLIATTKKVHATTEKAVTDPSMHSPTTTKPKPPPITTTTVKPTTTTKEPLHPTTTKPPPTTTKPTTTTKKPLYPTTTKPPTTTTTTTFKPTITTNPWKPWYPFETTTQSSVEISTHPFVETTTQSSVEATTPKHSYYPWRPWYPGHPGHLEDGRNQCYYKTQKGYPQMQWVCGRLQYYTPVECYLCCRYPYSMFAGCNKVNNYHCQSYGSHINSYN